MNSVLPVCRSNFSLLFGTESPQSLVESAAGLGYPALILADRNNLYGCCDFYYAAQERGVKPIIAAEVSTQLGKLTLACENHNGFKNLSRLITHYNLRELPSPDILYALKDNLICLAGIESSLQELREIFDERLYIKLTSDRPSHAYRAAAEEGIRPIACPTVSFLNQNDYGRHCLLRAIDGGYLLDNLPPIESAAKKEYLKPPISYSSFFAPFPDALKNNSELAERCNLSFPNRKNILPDIKVDGDHFEKLRNDSLAGLRGKLSPLPGTYLARLEYELGVIARTGFVDYFLIVGEIIDFCRRNGIAVVGRGSAAGSLASFGLGITQVDPIKEHLYFERFLNEARSDCPDIDLDIDWRRRDDILDFIYKKYGDQHVAMIASYIHFQPRLAIREAAKALGIAPESVDDMLKRFPDHPFERNDFPPSDSGGLAAGFEYLRPVLEAARSIYGLPRHLGIHSGGIVITPEPLTDYVPLERATKGIVVTQCDMYQAEKIGLVKIDILGQRGLAVIADCREAVGRITGHSGEVPDNDRETYEVLRKGKTIGVFQIESPGMRALLRDLKPCELNDITLGLALIRPGASESGMKQVFLNRFHGKEKTLYPHRNLEDVLKETFGVFIYQEQVIVAAQKIAGFNLAGSDMLRRAITKHRKKGDTEKLNRRFLDGAQKNGVDNATAKDILAQLRQFALFGFCKAHAATYGYLAYQSAYFKTHYPDIFMAAVLRNGGGYYPPAIYVAEARRLGIKIMPPDVNLSESADALRGNGIYIGMARVRDVSANTLEQIEKYRPFRSLGDFLSKVQISDREMENLIKVGFFDSIESSRPKLLWQLRLMGRNDNRSRHDIFSGRIAPPQMRQMPDLIPFSRFEVFKAEKSILEMAASFHPLSLFENYAAINMEGLSTLKDRSKIRISGWLADRKRIKTRNGKSMVFLTFESLDDTFEVVLFPDIYAKYNETVRRYHYLTIEGNINIEDGTNGIVARRIIPCPTGLRESRYI